MLRGIEKGKIVTEKVNTFEDFKERMIVRQLKLANIQNGLQLFKQDNLQELQLQPILKIKTNEKN